MVLDNNILGFLYKNKYTQYFFFVKLTHVSVNKLTQFNGAIKVEVFYV